jgi:hypothetical protein
VENSQENMVDSDQGKKSLKVTLKVQAILRESTIEIGSRISTVSSVQRDQPEDEC